MKLINCSKEYKCIVGHIYDRFSAEVHLFFLSGLSATQVFSARFPKHWNLGVSAMLDKRVIMAASLSSLDSRVPDFLLAYPHIMANFAFCFFYLRILKVIVVHRPLGPTGWDLTARIRSSPTTFFTTSSGTSPTSATRFRQSSTRCPRTTTRGTLTSRTTSRRQRTFRRPRPLPETTFRSSASPTLRTTSSCPGRSEAAAQTGRLQFQTG
jgi:hypothetical protein